ncbi:MAG TPA: hypothetical protein VJP04_01870, partial [Terriglobales bacterium]|nr:hypothetical protein [Terriglobales bacterium]
MHNSSRPGLFPALTLLAIALSAAAFFLFSQPRPAVVHAARKPASTQQSGAKDPRLGNAYRFQRGGWTYVHLEGTSEQIGYQHGYLLAPEIKDTFEAIQLRDVHDAKRDWQFFRDAARKMLWPHIEAEYQQELTGIAEGLKARGVALD